MLCAVTTVIQLSAAMSRVVGVKRMAKRFARLFFLVGFGFRGLSKGVEMERGGGGETWNSCPTRKERCSSRRLLDARANKQHQWVWRVHDSN